MKERIITDGIKITHSDDMGLFIHIVGSNGNLHGVCLDGTASEQWARDLLDKPSVDVGEILQKIYDCEQHIALGWMWDGGLDFKIHADLQYIDHQVVHTTGRSEIDEGIRILADTLAESDPDANFAIWWREQNA